MIVDDHAVVRSGLAAFLLVYDDLEMVSEADSGEQARVYKDAYGNVLVDGDSVTVIKDLKVKGSSSVVKVGIAHTRPGAKQEDKTLPAGPPLAAILPQVELKSLQVIGYDPGLRALELKDNRRNLLRLRQEGRVAFVLEQVVGRERPKPHGVTLSMGKELTPVLHQALQRLAGDAHHEPHAVAMRSLVNGLAEASGLSLDVEARAVTSPEMQEQMAHVGFAGKAGTAWSGFSRSAAPTHAPLANPEPVKLGSLDDVLLKATPGLELDSIHIAQLNGAKGFVLVADGPGNELALTQTKMTPPPQFTLEYRRVGQPPARMMVSAQLARQLAAVLKYCGQVVEGEGGSPPKGLNIVVGALGKVM